MSSGFTSFRPRLLLCLAILGCLVSLGNRIEAALGGGGASCHCPCTAQCSGGISCDCTGHSESCHRCRCFSVGLSTDAASELFGVERPYVQGSFADWFRLEPYPEIKVALEATMADTGLVERFHLRWVPDPARHLGYAPDGSFDARAYRAWRNRIDKRKPARIHAALRDDPATYQILDRDLRHFNQSLDNRFDVLTPDGSPITVFRSEATLGWEMISYLRETIGGLDDGAFAGEPHEARSAMYSLADTIELQLGASDFDRAKATIDLLIERAQARWLKSGERASESTLCAFRKLQNLLAPGALCQ